MDANHYYEIVLQEDIPDEIKEDIKENSILFNKVEESIHSVKSLLLRIKNDSENIKNIFRSYGYFDSKLYISIKKNTIHMNARLGTRSIVEKFYTSYPYLVPIKKYSFFNAKEILKQKKKIENFFQDNGYPFAESFDPKIYRHNNKVDIFFPFDIGEKKYFSDISITGLNKVSIDFVKKRLLWNPDHPFQMKNIQKTKKHLLATGLFSRIHLKTKNKKLILKIEEEKPKSLRLYTRYNTSAGPEIGLIFQNSNCNHFGQKYILDFQYGQKTKKVLSSYEIPDYFDPYHSLGFESYYENNKFKNSKNNEFAFNIFTQLIKKITWTFSVKAEKTLSTDYNGSRYKTVLGIPKFDIEYGKDIDRSIPEKGIVVGGSLSPHIGHIQKNDNKISGFTHAKLRFYYYYPLNHDFKVCTFLKGGWIPGIHIKEIPLKKRLFAGGVNSIRPYGYYKISPINKKGYSIGCNEILEYGVEVRYKMKKNIDVVSFFEGAVFKNNHLFGGGGGARYITELGTIRADIAFPFKRRFFIHNKRKKTVDNLFQIYVGIGQSF